MRVMKVPTSYSLSSRTSARHARTDPGSIAPEDVRGTMVDHVRQAMSAAAYGSGSASANAFALPDLPGTTPGVRRLLGLITRNASFAALPYPCIQQPTPREE